MRKHSTHLASLKDLCLRKDEFSFDEHRKDSVKLLEGEKGERKMRKK